MSLEGSSWCAASDGHGGALVARAIEQGEKYAILAVPRGKARMIFGESLHTLAHSSWAPVSRAREVRLLMKLASLQGGGTRHEGALPSPGSLVSRARDEDDDEDASDGPARPTVLDRLGPDDILDLARLGENLGLEYKSTLRVDLATGQKSRPILHSALKTIAGFLNQKGGLLLVGVDDHGELVGLHADYESFTRPNKRDEWVKCLSSAISTYLGDAHWQAIDFQIVQVSGTDIACVNVGPGLAPAYLRRLDKGSTERDYFVRTPSGTNALSAADAIDHAMTRWSTPRGS